MYKYKMLVGFALAGTLLSQITFANNESTVDFGRSTKEKFHCEIKDVLENDAPSTTVTISDHSIGVIGFKVGQPHVTQNGTLQFTGILLDDKPLSQYCFTAKKDHYNTATSYIIGAVSFNSDSKGYITCSKGCDGAPIPYGAGDPG